MKTIKDFITEKKSNYDFSCAMLYLDFPEMSELHSQIEKEDVYVDPQDSTFGLETEPHVTLLYGLHSNVGLDKVEPIVCEPTYSTVKAHNASLFENDKYDVLKFDIKGDQLAEVNSKLKQFPFTSDFPDYHPHMTVAYLKKGMGKKYVDQLKGKEYQIHPSHAVYSMANGEKHKMSIRRD